jgi:hypothetical protein
MPTQNQRRSQSAPSDQAKTLAKKAAKSAAKKAAKSLAKKAAKSLATSAARSAIAEAGEAAAAGAADVGLAATGVGIVVLAGEVAAFAAKFFINNDNKKREAYTQQFVQQASQKYPRYNVVICHPNHRVSGATIHQHYELPMTLGTCGYDIYFSQKGKQFTFVNQGDGGFINWAFNGEFNRNGNTLTAIQHA